MKYDGTFNGHEISGEGTWTTTTTNEDGVEVTETYKGDFENAKRHGHGEVKYSDKPENNFEADWENDELVEGSQ